MFDVKKLLEASEALGKEKNVDKDTIKSIAVEALEKAYIRILTGGNQPKDLQEPRVKVLINEDKGTVDFYQIKTIKEEVVDDMLEIELEDARDLVKGKKELKYGDDIEIHEDNINLKELSKIFINQFKNSFHQRLNDAEKTALYETYKDHVGEIVVGTVEKVEEKVATIKVDNNLVYLSRSDMIGDEIFKVGQQVKLYLADRSTDKKGRVAVTRSDPGFLKRLFEEEIQEVYDGDIIIKSIARIPGKRSKVAVYSNNPDIDATGSCIGKDGTRINNIVNQLGNGHDKEKIDVVAYSPDISLFIADSLRPAEVVGVSIDQNNENGKEATCIVKDGQYSKAVGLRGYNIRLAAELTGFDLVILEEHEALKENLKYATIEELKANEAKRIEEYKKSEFAKKSMVYKAEIEKAEELKKMEAYRLASIEEAKARKEKATREAEKSKPHSSSLEEELAKAKAAASRAVKRESEHVEIKTTTNLLDLEKQLEEQKEEAKKVVVKSHRPRKITESEVPNEEKVSEEKEKKNFKKMDIYTEEELRKIEEEENENLNANDEYDEEDIDDYDEYDEYYDDEK